MVAVRPTPKPAAPKPKADAKTASAAAPAAAAAAQPDQKQPSAADAKRRTPVWREVAPPAGLTIDDIKRMAAEQAKAAAEAEEAAKKAATPSAADINSALAQAVNKLDVADSKKK